MTSTGLAITVVTFTLLLLVQQSLQQQFAWRPQGRFGKRGPVPPQEVLDDIRSAISDENTPSSDINPLSSFLSKKVLEVPSFHTGDVVCNSAGVPGYYRCFRVKDLSSVTSEH